MAGAKTPSVSLAFHGAASTVTGSCFLLATERGRLLVDCGLFQGTKTVREPNYGGVPVRAEGDRGPPRGAARERGGADLFEAPRIRFTGSVEESKAINRVKSAGSGAFTRSTRSPWSACAEKLFSIGRILDCCSTSATS